MSDNDTEAVPRYTSHERANHWVVAVSFVLAALSGLALFHPFFFSLSALFGGGPGARIAHPYAGVVMFLFFFALMVRFWAANRMTQADRAWMNRIGDVIRNRDANLPEVGKYNAGQKILFWFMVVTVWLLLASGIVMWRAWFPDAFPIGLHRIAVVVHAVSATILLLGIIVHVYAAIWVKGTLRGMTRGSVGRGWARHHHPAWYREVSGRR